MPYVWTIQGLRVHISWRLELLLLDSTECSLRPNNQSECIFDYTMKLAVQSYMIGGVLFSK